ncbi:MAG TPA: hypothetical protein H9902_15690 [Candidatus Stackebrandtia faecavium]|nr:hypothetical protein [Candidatus Stackebrandtia faecavium]
MAKRQVSFVSLLTGLLCITLGVVGLVNSWVPMSWSTLGIIFASACTLGGLVGVVVSLSPKRR